MGRYLGYRQVTELTSLSESTVRRLIAQGAFPAPQEITPGRRVFEETAVRDAVRRLIAQRAAARRPTEPAAA